MASLCCEESGTLADARPVARMPAKIKVFVNIVDGRGGRLVLLLNSKLRNEYCRAINVAGLHVLEKTTTRTFESPSCVSRLWNETRDSGSQATKSNTRTRKESLSQATAVRTFTKCSVFLTKLLEIRLRGYSCVGWSCDIFHIHVEGKQINDSVSERPMQACVKLNRVVAIMF